ncbi:MAG: twin-arginine translocase subunit TatC [candidate division Zixibacteria bacterium]|nr:twin-arginine translocase subunit TatC [candidate division Zixibacteria bacterium]
MTEDRDSKEMPFLEHLEELRRRILKSLAAILIFGIAAFFFSDFIFDFLQYPLQKAVPDIQLHFFGVTEAFLTRIKLALLGGVFFAMPIILYQLWQFVVPGLLESEIKVIIPLMIVSTIFFVIGSGFCFYVVARYGLKYLIIANQPPDTLPILGLGSYYSFIMWLMIAFGLVFELPVIAYFLGKIGIINSKMMASGRRYAIIGILLVSSFITPPDLFTQVTLGVPLYLLYEASIIVVRLTGRREKPQEDID